MSSACPFCQPDPERLIFENDQFIGLWDGYPVSPGHVLVIPRRHIATWFDATREEQIALLEGIEQAREAILRRHTPDGFNIGINAQAAAGQTIFHLHIHVIPRYVGDLPDPRGGIRNVIPNKGNYLRDVSPVSQHVGATPHQGALIRGADDPLLPHLKIHLDQAEAVDICVAFVQLSGLRLVEEHLRDLLNRGGKLRFLTGDYLDITDPQALLVLLDLADRPDFQNRLELRVFESGKVSFHPKSYLFHFPNKRTIALVGSSNLSGSALQAGIEWNYRVVSSNETNALSEVEKAFNALFHHPSTQPISNAWIQTYDKRRRLNGNSDADISIELPEPPPKPHSIQTEALTALEATRREGNTAGLVVLATGLGKTWLSAFDSQRPEFESILFVAHREEILTQAIKTFRRIRPNATLGRYDGTEKIPDADVLFASIQTLGRQVHLRQFDRARFDYIGVDEFHHASSATYRNLIAHFTPKFLLGLTATPERTDGGDLLALCQENLVYKCDVGRGIKSRLLAPFHYFGVPDEVDYRNIPWRNSRFSEAELTSAVATQKRAQNALDQYRKRGGKRTLAFCCSQRHCDFMSEFFCQQGLRAVSVHSGTNSAPRAASLEGLEAGSLDVVFAVDMFNEGVDLPQIDTVLMLRPTESTILWMQQFGRGLRVADGKTHLTVIDYIGNHRIFLNKSRTLLNIVGGDQDLDRALNLLLAGEFELPLGCEVTYDLQAVEILRALLKDPSRTDALRACYLDFRERHGQRPTATELFHGGFSPKSLRTAHGSWLLFVKGMGDLSDPQQMALTQAADFLNALESTPMSKSFKMLTLLAVLDEDAFPGSISIHALANAFARLAGRSAVLRRDVGTALKDRPALIRLLESNPIDAWVGGRGTKGKSYFTYEDGRFSSLNFVAPDQRTVFQELVRELAEWRLAEYLSRTDETTAANASFTCKVSRSSDHPILSLPDRTTHPQVPSDWQTVEVDGKRYEANFGTNAVDVLREPGTQANLLPGHVAQWFGPDAGRPGTHFKVFFELLDEGYCLRPEINAGSATTGPELWVNYMREAIPPLFGLPFSMALWNVGFVPIGQQIFLLVTLEKDDLNGDHRYADKFLSPDHFQWQSQNRTFQASKHGQMLRHHVEKQIAVHLFVRRSKKNGSQSSPFYYCGPVQFEKWTGERPITINWRLQTAVPERFHNLFLITPNRT